jgi:branched-chain amino acid transport system permease protein
MAVPSPLLLAQSILAGLFVGSFYALLGLGVSLSWRFLRIINLAHFGLISLSAYLSYQLLSTIQINPLFALVALVPLFFLLGMGMQALFMRFAVGEFASVLVTFGLMIVIEALIQGVWTADFRRLETPYSTASFTIGPVYVPVVEAAVFVVTIVVTISTWAWLRFTYMGKALRASADNPNIAAAFAIDGRRLGVLLGGMGTASGAAAGVVVALITTLSPAQVAAWIGVVLATVILGGLGNPLGLLAAGIAIGVVEALTTAFTAPTWAPLVSFTLLILMLVLRPERL